MRRRLLPNTIAVHFCRWEYAGFLLFVFLMVGVFIVPSWGWGESLCLLGAYLVAVHIVILVHEFGHAAACFALGARGGTLVFGGGFAGWLPRDETVLKRWEADAPVRLFAVAFAGPLANFLFFAAVALAPSSEFLVLTGKFGACVGAANLLPILPMDGGRCLAALCSMGNLSPCRSRQVLRGTGAISLAGLCLFFCLRGTWVDFILFLPLLLVVLWIAGDTLLWGSDRAEKRAGASRETAPSASAAQAINGDRISLSRTYTY